MLSNKEKQESLFLRTTVPCQQEKRSVLFTESKRYGIRVKATDMKGDRWSARLSLSFENALYVTHKKYFSMSVR